jgi:hypothetical protein
MDFRLHIMAQVQILLCLLAEHVYYLKDYWQDAASDILFSVILIMLFGFFISMFCYNIGLKILRQRWFRRCTRPCIPVAMFLLRPCRYVRNRLESVVEDYMDKNEVRVALPKPIYTFRPAPN